jgi:putative transposase
VPIAEAVGYLRGKTTIRVSSRLETLRKRRMGRHFWTEAHCVSTVGSDDEKIRKYVQWQQGRDGCMDQPEMLDT